MLNLLICGSGGSTFHHEEDQGDPWNNSPCSSPTKARKNRRNNKNPYSSRGLDKFSALLNDLEEKRNKIYSQVDSRDISIVRFVYSNSNDWVPIVVKSKTNKEGKTKTRDGKEDEEITPPEISDADSKEVKQPEISEPKEKRKIKKRVLWNVMKLDKWRRPSYYLPAIIILILLLLTVFGRTFAIFCTCLGWYIVPTLKEISNTERSTKKKDYVRKLSEKKMVIKEINRKDYMRSISGVVEGKSAPHLSHQKSWS